jgi:membrane protease YdiL (CAAX protease family)
MTDSRVRYERLVALSEVLGVYGLIFALIWLAQDVPWRPPLLVAGLVLAGVCAASNRWHGDTREKIGWHRKHLRPCARLCLKIFSIPLLVLAAWAVTKPVPPLPKLLFGLLGYPLWALAQEYALLSFMANRLRDALGPDPWRVALLNGVLFGLVHLPNPLLTGICSVGGFAFTWIFLRAPHLLPIALVHAATGFLLSVIFQNFYPAMMVGPAYLRWTVP